MVQAHDVARAHTAFQDRLDAKFRKVRPVFNKIAQKRITRSEGKESQGSATLRGSVRKKSVDDLEARSITAHGDEFAIAVRVTAACIHSGFSGSSRFSHLKAKSRPAKPVKCARGQFPAASAAGCRIYDREIGIAQKETIAPRSSCLPICSARMTRLIFMAALRGKS